MLIVTIGGSSLYWSLVDGSSRRSSVALISSAGLVVVIVCGGSTIAVISPTGLREYLQLRSPSQVTSSPHTPGRRKRQLEQRIQQQQLRPPDVLACLAGLCCCDGRGRPCSAVARGDVQRDCEEICRGQLFQHGGNRRLPRGRAVLRRKATMSTMIGSPRW